MITEDKLSVLITTSGIGSRIGNLTKYTNKCLVRVGDKPAISHIIELYPEDTLFYITLGYYGDLVKQYLSLAHPKRNFTFINIDKYFGPGSSLGYSLWCSRKYLQNPFIFHACDTITKHYPLNTKNNWCAGFKKMNSSHYRTLNVQNNNITKVNEKGEQNYDYEYMGICRINDYEQFWKILSKIIINSSSSLSDVDVIKEMLKTCSFKLIEYDDWEDIGNIEGLKKSRSRYKSTYDILDKDEEDIYFLGTKVIKFFSNSKINEERVRRVEYLNGLTPKMVGSTKNFYCYTIEPGELCSKTINERSIVELLDWANEKLWVDKKISEENKEKCKKFYFDKTETRIQTLLSQVNKKDEATIINDLGVPPISKIMQELKNENFLINEESVNYHGDFILDNIIKTNHDFCLIDWRQNFAGNIRHGDIYYDLAKMNHNIFFNHENIKNGLYEITEKGDNINVDMKINYRLFLVKKSFDEWCNKKGYNLKKINILSSIIWINMSPLHEYPLNKFLFYFGKYNLWRTLNG